jgi:D-arabinose 1-dehydrogenase-like Zn-dependent alcohol dehydrogenase
MLRPEYEPVGRINALGKDVDTLTVGERVGVP